MTPLALSLSADMLWPERTAFAPRTDLQVTRLLGYTPYNIDAVTTICLGMFGSRPTVRHISGCTDEILDFLSFAGIDVGTEDRRIFRTGEEAAAIARALVDDGFRLIAPYPLPPSLYPAGAELVPGPLFRRLSDKTRLGEIAPASTIPARRIVPIEEVEDASALPVYLKAAGDEPTGWGYAVRHCATPEALRTEVAAFRSLGIERVIVEEALPIEHCWCANVAIGETVHWIGAALQTFARPGQQEGSLIDPAAPFPREGIDLALQVAETARVAGFRGVAAFDIGRSADGRLYLFDPNFRINASTHQILLHEAAERRSGLPASRSFNHTTSLPCSEMLVRAKGPVEEGWLIPNRVIDEALLPAANGRSVISGFVMGRDRDDTSRRAAELTRLLS